ncbi:hypothetical protein KC326_g141 [Hortaea werneckii]|nr:hypothetical protein KC326_g141 [Hortaea werneckii]
MPCARPIWRRLSLRSSLASSVRICSVLPSLLACARASAAACEYQKTSWSAKVSSVVPRHHLRRSGHIMGLAIRRAFRVTPQLLSGGKNAVTSREITASQLPNLATTGSTLHSISAVFSGRLRKGRLHATATHASPKATIEAIPIYKHGRASEE